ncbi:MAG: leucine-rich repeat protein [Clostridia bacterium]|nr:leucine-rich repeat protein [Oscillospiraceae bacterium]MBQ3763329.1 leucine-rich repeat protein [Clostridia bacterium]
MKTRFTALFLAVALLCALLPASILTVGAEVVLPPDEFGENTVCGDCGENMTWTLDLDTGAMTIEGSGPMDDYEPAINAPWYKYNEVIKTVVVGSGVTSIGDYAFENVAFMTSVSLPDTLQRIGSGSFSFCSDLAALDLPEHLTTIGASAFTTCSSLETLVLPASLTSIGYNVFDNCFGLKSVTLPDGLTSIAQSMFSRCTALTEITIPESVTSIGSSAFFHCTGLTSITIPGSVKTVGSSAFTRCSGLTSVTLEEGITELGAVAFGNCTGLTSITLPESLTTMGDGTFNGCTGLTGITIPCGVTKLEEYLFDGCSALASVTIPTYVTDVFYGAFRGCAALTDVYYEGTEAMWSKINISQYNYYLTDANIHFASPDDCAHEHTHPERTEPGCTEVGYDRTVCDRCGTVLSETELPAVGHDFIEQGPMAPTCTMEGFSVLRTCSRCDYYYIEWTPALGHSWDEGVITVPATETTDGEMTYTCTRCGVTMTEVIPATGEDECRHEHGHPEHKDPSCTEDGFDRQVCDDCGEVIAETVLPAMGHDLVVDAAVAPTCTATGLTEGKHCLRCDYTVAQQIIPMLAHSFKDGVCTVCGAKDPDYKPPVQENPFRDVKENEFYYDAVLWAVNAKPQVTAGTSDTTFSPNDTCTRAQVVTFLWRAKGCPEPKSTDNPFTDVSATDYYFKAVLWAKENDVTAGTSATTFSPNAGCTRAQVVTFLWRAEGQPKPTSSANPFKDVTGGYYYDAVLWAVEKKITAGTSDTTFSPDNTCTRGQIVTFLYRAVAEA